MSVKGNTARRPTRMSEQLAGLLPQIVVVSKPKPSKRPAKPKRVSVRHPSVIYLAEPRPLLTSGYGPLVLGIMSDADHRVRSWSE